jgi:hypothetical protein
MQWSMEQDRAWKSSRFGVWRLTPVAFAIFALSGAGAPGSASAASPQQAIAADEALERTEIAEDHAEEASLALVVAEVTPTEARRIEVLKRHIERINEIILKIRESKEIDRTLPHTTTRWLVHLPKKRAHLKELRERRHELHMIISELRHS